MYAHVGMSNLLGVLNNHEVGELVVVRKDD